MLSASLLNSALNYTLVGLERALLSTAKANEIFWQRQVHDQVPNIAKPLDNPFQYTDLKGEFQPNEDQAEERARHRIQLGVVQRLRGAIAHYQNNNQMECVRQIVLALGSIFCILDWQEASAWCNEQNRALYEIHRRKRDAA